MFFIILINISKIVLAILAISLLVLYFYFRKQYKYWKARNVPYIKPYFPFGNITWDVTKSVNVLFKKLYDETKHHKYCGVWFLFKPMLMVNDPDLIQRIFIKNFSNFPAGGSYFDKKMDPFSGSLFTLEGARWKYLRLKLSPVFTTGKLKAMLPLILKCCDDLQDVLKNSAKMNDVVDVKALSKRYTIQVVLSLTFGIESNFIKNSKSTVGKMAADIFMSSLTFTIKFFLSVFVPDVAKILQYSLIPKRVADYFIQIIRDIVYHRERYHITEKGITQSLIGLLKKGYTEDGNRTREEVDMEQFTFNDLVAQSMTFLAGGIDTSAATIQFAIYELAANPEIQEAAREEVKKALARHDGEVTYEAVFETEYLSRIIDETLRKYSVVPGTMRKCAAEFKDPDSSLIIEKDSLVLISFAGVHRDERYYPNPDKFDPDRFIQENKALRPHCTYMPFGDGPRICIGMKLAQLQIRVVLFVLLSKFRFTVTEKTPSELSFEFKSVITTTKGQNLLKVSLL